MRYWFWGRPSVVDLWHDLRDVFLEGSPRLGPERTRDARGVGYRRPLEVPRMGEEGCGRRAGVLEASRARSTGPSARLAQLRASRGRGACAGASSPWTSGRTRASTGCARCRTSARGTSAMATAGSSSSAFMRPSSGSSTTSATSAARSPSSLSAIRSSSTTTSRSGGRSRTGTGPPSTSSIATGRAASITSARAPTRRSSGRSSTCWASRRRPSPTSMPVASPQAAEWETLGSPETYLVAAARRAAPRRRAPAGSRSTSGRSAGAWSVGEEAAELETDGSGSISYRFQARDLNLVLAPPGLRRASPLHRDARRPTRPVNRPAAWTSTRRARACSTSRGCTSSSAGRDGRSPERSSRSRSSIPGVRAYVFTFG